MSDVSPLSGISGLLSDSPCLFPLLFFLPSPLALSFCLVLFLLMVHFPDYFFSPENSQTFSLRVRLLCMALV